MSGAEKRYGLLGASLGHSHSPLIHAQFAPYRYDLYEVAEADLPAFIRGENLGGLNVTIPYKQTVIPLCDRLGPEARAIGSVNTLVYGPDGEITGHNTDFAGLTSMIRRAGIELGGRKVLVFGAGGTSVTAVYAAQQLGAREVVVISRRGEDNYDNLDRHRDAQVLVNTTPVGMYPDNGGQVVDLTRFPSLRGVVDVVYNPLRTRLVQQALALGLPATGGLPMLVGQAARAAELFLGSTLPEERVEAALRTVEAAVTNIVLVGMPGCGKSSVGSELAHRTGRTLLDTDEMVERAAGRAVPAIIREDGEPAFRALESEAVAAAAAHSGCIVATGGGAVLLEENRRVLAQNGRAYLIHRPLELLAVADRPLSVDLEALRQTRWPLYTAFAHRVIDNTGAVADAAAAILEDFQ